MKKLSKILCAVLVLAMLCSSLVFVVGAEEAADSTVTSVAASAAEIFAAIKYEAEDNLFTRADLTTNTVDGWNNPGALQAHVVTNTKTGETYFHQFADGSFNLKNQADVTDGNEFINFKFKDVALKYEEGYHEYIIVEYDVAHKAVTGKFTVPSSGAEKTSSLLKQEVIVRGSTAGTSWSTVQKFSELATEEFAHVTTIYDYTSGTAYSFIDGVLALTYTNGALTDKVLATYLAGESLTTSEWRVGSNSYDELKLDNVYIRHQKLATANDTIANAIKSGKLSDWDGNIYVGFVPSVSHSDVAIDKISDINSNVLGTTSGNVISGSAFQNHQPIYSVANSTAGTDSYATVYANADGAVEKKNPGWWFTINTDTVERISVAAGSTAYYVVDFDLSTSGEILPYIDVSCAMRRASDVQGYPFGTSAKPGEYVVPGEWTHFTLVGDIAANKLYLYANGEFKAEVGVAYNAAQLTDGNGVANTEIIPQSIRFEFSISANTTTYTEGMHITLDNVCERVYTSADLSDGLKAAVDSKSLSSWNGNITGKAGEKLPTLAVVNGTECSSAEEINAVITANKAKNINLEFKAAPIAPINFRAEGSIDTNGMPIESLVKFDEACSAPVVDGDIYTVTLGWSANYSIKTPTGSLPSIDIAEIKYEHSGNILSKISTQHYQLADQRSISYVTNLDTGDVFVNDYPVGNISSSSDTYIQIMPGSRIEYNKGVGQTFVFDFDMAVYDRETAAINLISRYGTGNSGAWGNNSTSTDRLFENVPLGEFAHVTIVVCVDSRIGYYFINNELVYAIDNTITEQAERLEALRCFGNSTADLLYDNVCIRNINNVEIENIAAAGDLSKWSGAIYGANYKLPVAPTVVTVDGVPYGSVEAANEALAEDSDTAKIVEIKHIPFKGEERTFKIRTAAEVNTQGLDVALDWNTGIYEFNPGNGLYESSETGLAYASSKLIHTSVGDIHTFTTIDASNCFQTATPVNWYYDENYENYDVVFYVFGDTIAPLNYKAYVEDGVYYQDQWQEFTVVNGQPVMGDIVEEYPVASATTGEKNFLYELVTKEVDFIVSDIKLGAVVNSNIELTVYVNKYETLTTGDVVVIDGVEYVALRFELAPHEIDKMVEATFIITDDEGNEYPQLQRVSFLEYAEDVLSGDYTDADKKVVANLLAYANEARVLFGGEKIAEVTALLETYASYVESAQLPEKADTSSLSSVIRSAALRLNGTPEFVFKVARGFKGTITFTYEGVTGPVEVNVSVDATKGEQLVSLPIDVCDLQADITITAGEVSGIYNLATYAQSLENNDFAVALYNYSAAANAHKTGLVFVYVVTGFDAKGNPITEIYGEYTPGSKIDIPFLRDGLTLTWYLGYGDSKEAIDINNYVITENITLSYTETVNATLLENVTDEALKSINKTLLKNFDSCTFVTTVKDGKPVEAIRLTRTSAWPTSNNIESFWTEQVYTLDSSRKVVSISFDYLVLGKLGRHEAASGRSYGAGIFYVKYSDTVAAEQGLKDSLKEVDSGTLYSADGAWHTITYVASEALELDSFMINFYKLEGDALITNIKVEYAPFETYNEDGSLNTTVVLKENVTDKTLTTIVESKIKQCDQAKPGSDPTVDKFAEGGTAAYVNAVKDGEYVEGLYFSRSVEWTGKETAQLFTEFRFAVNNEQAGAIVTGISFDYIINGTVEENTRYQFTGLDGNKFYADAYVQIKTPTDHPLAGDKYPELEGTDLVLDGEWHTMSIDLGEGVEIIDILLNLYHFQGEMVISNLVIEYAE